MSKNIVAVLLMAFLLLQCSGKNVTGDNGGGASETIAIVEVNYDSIKITVTSEKTFSIEAYVCSNEYSAIDSTGFHVKRVMSGISDEWLLPQLDTGTYNVILTDNIGKAAIFQDVINTSKKSDSFNEQKKFRSAGTVRGIFTQILPDNTIEPVEKGIVCIPGTFLSAITGKDGSFELVSVPEGNYTIKAKPNERTYTNVINQTVEVSGDSTSVVNISLMKPY